MSDVLNGDRPTDTGFEGWAVLELFGHKRLAGYVSAQQIASGSLIRIDVPATEPREGERAGPTAAYSKLVGLAAVYGITPVTEDVARRAAREIERWNNPLTEPNDLPTPAEVEALAQVVRRADTATAREDESGFHGDDRVCD